MASSSIADELGARRWTGLAGRLLKAPYDFDFFQAVRLLQSIDPTRVAVGRGGPPGAEAVRFRARASLAFPPSQIYAIARAGMDASAPELTQAFFGLTGPNGVLPRHYTELLLRIERDVRGAERGALRDWFDLFNHRLISLFFRSWEKYRFYGAYARESSRTESALYQRAVLSLCGLGTEATQGRLRVVAPGEGGEGPKTLARVDDLAVLYYANLFARRPRNAASLEALVGDYFRVPTRVRQFQGQWFRLEDANQTRLGGGPGGIGGQRLGVSAVVGERVWDVKSKFRLRLGPLDYDQFLEFLPDRAPTPARKAFFLLCHLTRLYVGPGVDHDVQLVLKAGAVPEYALGDEDGVGARLGWNVWLRSGPLGRDADDAVFEADAAGSIADRPA